MTAPPIPIWGVLDRTGWHRSQRHREETKASFLEGVSYNWSVSGDDGRN
jgi:hypothetical protein